MVKGLGPRGISQDSGGAGGDQGQPHRESVMSVFINSNKNYGAKAYVSFLWLAIMIEKVYK